MCNELVKERSFQFQNLKKTNPTNLIYKYKTVGKSHKN